MCKEAWRFVKILYQASRQVLQKNLPTGDHEDAWKQFERLMAIRCNVSFLSKLVYTLIFMGLGRANFQKS